VAWSSLEVRVGHPIDLKAAFLDLFRKWCRQDEGDEGQEEDGLK
jgi:hypothetical protein